MTIISIISFIGSSSNNEHDASICVIIPFPSSITRRTMVFPPILWPLRFQSLSSWASAWPRPWCAPDWSWDADPGAQHRGTIRRMRDGYGYQAVPEVLLQHGNGTSSKRYEKMACPGNIGICQCQPEGTFFLGQFLYVISMIWKSNDDTLWWTNIAMENHHF